MLEARDKGTLIMLKSLVILSPVVTWKINEMNLPDISRQSAEGVIRLLLTVTSKREKR